MAAARYLVKDVDRAIAFYTGHLGFKLDHRAAPAFASVSKGDLILRLSGPGSSGARPMPDARTRSCKRRECDFATRWRAARAEGRSRSKIRTAIRSSPSSRPSG